MQNGVKKTLLELRDASTLLTGQSVYSTATVHRWYIALLLTFRKLIGALFSHFSTVTRLLKWPGHVVFLETNDEASFKEKLEFTRPKKAPLNS